MRAQANPAGVADANAGGHGVIGHAGEFVDTVNGQGAALGPGLNLTLGQLVQGNGAFAGPGHVGQLCKQASQVQFMGFGLARADQGQFQVHLGGRAGLSIAVQRRDKGLVAQGLDRCGHFAFARIGQALCAAGVDRHLGTRRLAAQQGIDQRLAGIACGVGEVSLE